MKHLRYSLLTLFLGLCLASCKKSFLEVEDNTTLIRQQYITDLNTAQQFLNGIYVQLGKDFYIADYQIYPDLVADNIKPDSWNTFILFAHYNWDQTPGSPVNGISRNLEDLWRIGYQIIRSCNFIIEKAGELNAENPAKSKQMQAEAYSIRALVHFVLVNTFAQSYNFSSNANHPGIPYIISSDWTDPYKRNTVAEVYTGMVSDLTTAILLFPSGSSNTLAMNQNAAKALLARIYLFKEEWAEAKSLATEVAAAVPLLPANSYPSKLFTLQETEALFQLAPASTTAIPGSYNTYYQGFYFIDAFFATKDIVELLTNNPNDSRKNWIKPGDLGTDSIKKYPTNILPGFGNDEYSKALSYYPTLLRSSEMFLTVAEAAAKIGDENTARIYLDAIRKRADPTAESTITSGVDLLNLIYTERRKELAFEGYRMFDLLRWKQGVTRSDAALGAPLILNYPNNKAVAPIPEIDVKNAIPQNAGY